MLSKSRFIWLYESHATSPFWQLSILHVPLTYAGLFFLEFYIRVKTTTNTRNWPVRPNIPNIRSFIVLTDSALNLVGSRSYVDKNNIATKTSKPNDHRKPVGNDPPGKSSLSGL